jgi:hypothetical protein
MKIDLNRREIRKPGLILNTWVYVAIRLIGSIVLFMYRMIILEKLCILSAASILACYLYALNNQALRNPTNIKTFDRQKFSIFINDYCKTESSANHESECLEQLSIYHAVNISSFQSQTQRKTFYHHTYWSLKKSNRLHFNIMRINILSYLATQNLSLTKLLIWTDKDLDLELVIKLRKEFKQFFAAGVIDIRPIEFELLCSAGVFNNFYNECIYNGNKPSNLVAYSDFVRFLVLYTYGGIYVDGDVIYLKDMKAFWNSNFAYKWSNQDYINTAVLGIDPSSNFTQRLYEAILSSTAQLYYRLVGFTRPFHPQRIFEELFLLNHNRKIQVYKSEHFRIYHSVLFDPAWLCNDNVETKQTDRSVCKFEDFYDMELLPNEFDVSLFFPNAFTYHLHTSNCGSCVVRNTSYFAHLQNHYKFLLEKKRRFFWLH